MPPPLPSSGSSGGMSSRWTPGSSGMLLAGSATISYTSGGVVDMTTAADVASGTAMTAQHRYLAAENTMCQLTITSDTAVLAPQGFYSVTKSDATDYNELANALKEMGLFKGGDTAYGDGLMLENAPTRIEGLIMFLRLLGEEEAALAVTDPCPFVDVPEWCQNYVTYAYAKGYTKGVGADSPELYFAPYVTITAGEYMTFVLRALGYQDSGDNPGLPVGFGAAAQPGAGVHHRRGVQAAGGGALPSGPGGLCVLLRAGRQDEVRRDPAQPSLFGGYAGCRQGQEGAGQRGDRANCITKSPAAQWTAGDLFFPSQPVMPRPAPIRAWGIV